LTKPDPSRRRIAVLGGGISGLTAAYTLARARQSGSPIEEFLVEASSRLGGVVQTERLGEFVLEAGPDSFLSEKPEAAALCRELGLGDSLIGSNDARRRTYILHRGKLVPLPDGLMLMVPTRMWPLVTTSLIPFGSKLSMARELFMPAPDRDVNADESVASFVSRHFGSAMLENIADPLLSGVYGGDSELLSARSVLNRFWQMEEEYGSLARGIRAARRKRLEAAGKNPNSGPPSASPLFTTLKNGLGQMTEALSKELDHDRVFTGRRIDAIEKEQANFESLYRIRCEGGASHTAHAVVLAMPAFECSRLLAGLDASLGESLRSIPYSSAMTVALGYDARVASRLPAGFGFLVPRKEHRRLLACTFVHNKFDHRAPTGQALLRCFLGGARDGDVLKLSDDAVLALVQQELRAVLNLSAEPLFYRIHRWPSSMAQYNVGHAEILARIETRLKNHPTLALAGNAYSGIGISDCVRTGRAAAERVLRLGT
jgi:oxygen-dependent protoporphyrinogen oxidase